MQRSGLISMALLLQWLALAPSVLAQTSPGDPEPPSLVRKLAEDGLKLYKDGKYQEAAALLEQAEAQYQAPQYLLYMGRAYARIGNLVLACERLAAAVSMVAPKGASAEFIQKFDKAKGLASAELEGFTKKIPAVRLAVSGPALGGVRVTDAGGPIRTTLENSSIRVEMNPGEHALHVEAEGFVAKEISVKALERSGDGPIETLSLALVPTSSAAPVSSNPVPSPLPVTIKPGDQAGKENSPPVTLSHRKQLGAYARGDFQVIDGGAVAVLGVSVGAHDFLEPYVGVLLGRDVGVEPGVAVYFFRGALKPRLDVGVPVFFEDTAYAGVRAAAGLQWDPSRHFGVFVQVGGSFFPEVPAGYNHAVFLPSLGIQGRL